MNKIIKVIKKCNKKETKEEYLKRKISSLTNILTKTIDLSDGEIADISSKIIFFKMILDVQNVKTKGVNTIAILLKRKENIFQNMSKIIGLRRDVDLRTIDLIEKEIERIKKIQVLAVKKKNDRISWNQMSREMRAASCS
ncbi:MAG: hypothetical protein QG567_942, partial [Campylobacterota bacterium]|nr:hypothetical protein [Campylobacterota bacterium]